MRESEGKVDLCYCLALILGFCGCLAAFRCGLDAAFGQERSASPAPGRPAAIVLASCVFLLCGGLLCWITEGSPLPLSAAFVALFQFVFADRRSEAELGRTRSERSSNPRPQDPRYHCAACDAPVPEGLDQCPCCAERVPWEARAAEVLPIPTSVSSADASSLPLPADVEEALCKRGTPEYEAAELQASTQTRRSGESTRAMVWELTLGTESDTMQARKAHRGRWVSTERIDGTGCEPRRRWPRKKRQKHKRD